MCAALAAILVISFTGPAVDISAATSQELKKQRDKTQSQLNSANSKASSLESEQESVSEELDQKTEEIAQNMTSISLMEDDIADLQDQINAKTLEYNDALERQQKQYSTMKKRIQFMYEKGDSSYVQLLLNASSISDALNKADYVQKLYDYDRKLLKEYEETTQEVKDAKKALVDEQSELETTKAELEENQTLLEQQQAELQEKYDNYDELISEARSEAALLKRQVAEQNSQISAAESAEAAAEAARRQAEAEEAARKAAELASASTSDTGTSTDSTDNTNTTDTGNDTNTNGGEESSKTSSSSSSSASSTKTYAAAGSATGSNVVSYAEQFVGNPYVYGGTSLTNGADCSGFTQSVYKAFGYSIPRTSYDQMYAGTDSPVISSATADTSPSTSEVDRLSMRAHPQPALSMAMPHIGRSWQYDGSSTDFGRLQGTADRRNSFNGRCLSADIFSTASRTAEIVSIDGVLSTDTYSSEFLRGKT